METEITGSVVKNTVRGLIKGEDYRAVVLEIIDSQFLQFTIDFFKKVVDAKIKNQDITGDWFKKEFLKGDLPKKEIAINAGLNIKSITNIHGSAAKSIVIDASKQNYRRVKKTVAQLIKQEKGLEVKLTLRRGQVSVDLSASESLVVINAVAVTRASIRGGAWSKMGKQVEAPLMEELCKSLGVSKKNFEVKEKGQTGKGPKSPDGFSREVDFYLVSNDKKYNCEVKLMGKGNPESADAVFARDTDVFIADTISSNSKNQLDSGNIEWIELRGGQALKEFARVLDKLKIPYKRKPGKPR